MDKWFFLQLMMPKWNSTLFNVGGSNNCLNFNNNMSFDSSNIMQNRPIFGNNLNKFNTQNRPLWNNPYEVLNNYNKTVNSVSHTNFQNNVNSVQSTPPETQSQSVLKANINKSQEFLQKQLSELSDTDLKKIGISPEKRDRLLKYISNIKYDEDPLHDTMHGGNKKDGYAITVNTKLQDSDNMANMVTMLMHEANHCDEAYLRDNPSKSEIGNTRYRDASGNPITAPNINTKWEEKACETLGIMTCAVLIDKGELPNYSRYNNHQFAEYLTNTDLLNKDIEEWCNNGYTNYIEDFAGNVTFEHMRMEGLDISGVPDTKIQIQKGDIVKVNGQEYTIGNGIFMESSNSAPIIQLCDYNHDEPIGLIENGRIIFDGLEPTQSEKDKVGLGNITSTAQTVEVVRNGEVVYTGKVYKEIK